MSFLSETIVTARAIGGSFKTIQNRILSLRLLALFLYENNIKIQHLRDLELWHVSAWIEDALANGVTARSCQNMLSDLRVCLRTQTGGLDPNVLKTGMFFEDDLHELPK